MKKATFRIDYGDRRTPALLHDIHTWLHVNARDGWRIREEDLVDEEEQEGRLTLLMVLFDSPQDAADFTRWRDFDRWTPSL